MIRDQGGSFQEDIPFSGSKVALQSDAISANISEEKYAFYDWRRHL
jgi:hypothetical protein